MLWYGSGRCSTEGVDSVNPCRERAKIRTRQSYLDRCHVYRAKRMSHYSWNASVSAVHFLLFFVYVCFRFRLLRSFVLLLFVFVLLILLPPFAPDTELLPCWYGRRFGFTPLMLAASMQRAPGDEGGIDTGPNTAYSLCEVRSQSHHHFLANGDPC